MQLPLYYFLDTNIRFTCRKNPNNNCLIYANNPGIRINYPELGLHENLTLNGRKALKLTVSWSCGTEHDPLDLFIDCIGKDVEFFFDRRIGKHYQSDEDKKDDEKIDEYSDKEKDEKIEEESHSSDSDAKTDVKENAD